MGLFRMKIMIDAMFGKLGHFLRILGFDTEIADKSWPDTEILEKTIEQSRMLITRDKEFYDITKRMLKKEGLGQNQILFIEYDDVETQLSVFFTHMKIDPIIYQWNHLRSNL